MEAATEKRADGLNKSQGRRILLRNVGGIDRLVRIVAGVALASLGLFQISRGHGGGLIVLLGTFVLVMASIGFCPLYVPFGISTARKACDCGRLARRDTAVNTARPAGRTTNR